MEKPQYSLAMDPELKQILDRAPPIPPFDHSSDIASLRARLVAIKTALTAANTSAQDIDAVDEKDEQIPTRDGALIKIRIYRSKSRLNHRGPVAVMYHGGGFCLGGLESESLFCRKVVTELDCVVIDVDYRLAPEHPFPTPVHDAYDALKRVAVNFDSLAVDPRKGFIVGGISAGANLAATLSHLYRDDHLSPPLTGTYLCIPSLVSPEAVPDKYAGEHRSAEENKNAPLLDQKAIDFFKDLYKGNPYSPLMSPLLFPTGHQNLPPTYFQVCGLDPLRDDSVIYERILREECGVKTRIDMYAGLPHGIWSFFPGANFSKRQLKDSLDGMAWLTQQSLGG